MLQLSRRLLFAAVSFNWYPKVHMTKIGLNRNKAASTVAANIILRSSVAAGFPLFTRQMFEKMGVQWACTLLGSLAAIMIPIPLAFRVYGPWLRRKSKLLD